MLLSILLWYFEEFLFLWEEEYLLKYVFTNPSTQAGCDTRSSFKAEFNRFEFRVVFLLDWLSYQGYKFQSVLLFTHNWRKNDCIHIFTKGISFPSPRLVATPRL